MKVIIDFWIFLTIIIVGLFLWFIFLYWDSNRKLKKLRRDYNEKENKSRRRTGELEGGTGGITEPVGSIQGDGKHEGRELLPSADVPDIEPNRTSVKKDKSKHRRFRFTRKGRS